MTEAQSREQSSRLKAGEILYIIFKHKRRILCCALVGFLGALVVFLLTSPMYKSEAKLFLPYVVDRTPVDATNEAIATSRANDAIMNSELEILTSWDLAAETASSMRYNGVSAGPNLDNTSTAVVWDLAKRIEVTATKGMNVINVSFKDRDPELAVHFLRELLQNYREKHLKVHRSPEALAVVSQRRDEVRRRLEQTDSELKRLKEQIQILSLADTTASLSAAIAKNIEDLNRAEAEQRGQESRVEALENLLLHSSTHANENMGGRPSAQEIEQYRTISEQLSQLRMRESQLLLTYPPDSRMVKIPRKQISELEERRRELENRYPDLVASAQSLASGQMQQPDLISEKARLAAMKSTVEVLKIQLRDFEQKREQFADIAPQIARLERDKELLELNYKNTEASLSKAEDDKAVDWSKIPNIASLQEPAPAVAISDPIKTKLMAGLGAGGLLFALGWAFLREVLIDRTIKRSVELERGMRIPVLQSIPYIAGPPHLRLNGNGAVRTADEEAVRTDSCLSIAPWSLEHFIRPFCESIRDRMIVSFELQNLHHKPKLIGVTGFSTGAGCSTLAGGLAAALSETGDGKVLLVDMNVRDGEMHPFFDGKASPLASILKPEGSTSSAADNLYLATASGGNTTRVPMGLKRFHSLIPSLKSADFDYIIFDMPPLDAPGPSLGMAAFMDKVLLVLEAEHNDRDSVDRVYSELVHSRADVSCVFNKTRSYGPKWIEGLS